MSISNKSRNAPYNYQNTVFDTFKDGHDIILQAPTGAGKTRAALRPGLYGFEQDFRQYPQRIVYVAPMRTLVSSQFREVNATAKAHPKWLNAGWKPTIQTGEQSHDPKFEGQIIFATVDQVLASFLNIPYGLPRRFDNLNAGAFIGAYLIFDEFHLYPTQQMLLTVLAMLKMLQGVSRFMLMTATFSRPVLQALESMLGATGISAEPGKPLHESIFKDIERLQEQQRTWRAQPGTLGVEDIHYALDYGDRILIICNTVDRAQQIYTDLLSGSLPTDVQTQLLHSRFYQADRQQHESHVLGWLGKDNQHSNQRYVVVATQVVEVGLDISADVLLTECAPAASLIQRAGRCARWGGSGEVWVYQPPIDAHSGEVNYAPYHTDGLTDVSHKTWDALASSDFNGQLMGYDRERALIDLAHSEHDEAHLINGLSEKIAGRIHEVTQCMRERDIGYRHRLIRESGQASLYIAAKPNETLEEDLHIFEVFSVSQGRIAREFEAMQANEVDAPFYISAAVEMERDSEDSQQKTIYKWHPLKASSEVYRFWQFVAHPQAVHYDPEHGLRWSNPDSIESPPSPQRERTHPIYPEYNADTYVEHVVSLINAYRRPATNLGYNLSLQKTYAYGLRRILGYLDLKQDYDQDAIDGLICLMLALHDVGKLNQRWQTWIQTRQATFAEEVASARLDGSELLAHTDQPNLREKERVQAAFDAKRVAPRGTHAVEGAVAGLQLILDTTRDDPVWLLAMVAAICQHHTPGVTPGRVEFTLHPDAAQAVATTLKAGGFPSQQCAGWVNKLQTRYAKRVPREIRTALEITRPTPQRYYPALLYYLLVRILRLADHRSSDYLNIYPVEERG